MRRFSFLLWPVITGIFAAIILLQFFPDLFAPKVTTVEIRQTNQANSQPATGLGHGPVSYADAVNVAAPAVVNIYTRTLVQQKAPLKDDPFYQQFLERRDTPQRQRIESSLGSGVILSPQGYIATNNHVIEGADSIVVALKDGREAMATLVGNDPETDLAVLKVELGDLPTITLSDSDTLQVGDVTLAIGNPFGVGQTVTMGIISATGRNSLGLNTYEDFIQTDAAINPGNSGGALIDAYGNLIGINTVIYTKSGGSQGIGFAIPSNLTKQVMQDLIQHGRVIRGWLGIEVQELTPQLAESFGMADTRGLIIAGIFRNSPAHIAGMQPGDIMVSINKQPIQDRRSSMDQIAKYKPGEEITIEVIRNNQELSLPVKIVERPRSRS
ncbi:S1C family serine protease [Pontibacterium sp.]|uniref:S1C family serine protease n=1 Tax=Pontibacterium sp. TaxID=2036026 RepID=UPI0035175D2B